MVDFIVGYSNDFFGNTLAAKLGCEFRAFRNEYYPDGSPAPKIAAEYKEIEGKHVLIVYRRKQLPERNSVCRFLANYPRVLRSLLDPETFNAAKVDVFHPYFILGRQDHNPKTDDDPNVKRRDKGKDIGYKYEIGLFKGCNRLITFHPHFHREPGEFEESGVHIVALNAVPAMVKYAKEMGMHNSIVVSPDLSGGKNGNRNGYSIAKSFAEHAGFEFMCIESERQDSMNKNPRNRIDAGKREIAVVDDIASTLGTLKGALDNIDNPGEMDALFVHAVLSKDGHERAQSLTRGSGGPLRSISATNCIDSDFSSMDITDEIVKFYKRE